MLRPARAVVRLLLIAVVSVAVVLPADALGFAEGSLQGDVFASNAAAELTGAAAAAAPPAGFVETAALAGIAAPTAVRFAPNGHVFVAEKAGRILEYDSLSDPTPSVYADLRTAVLDYEDRGLLGLAIDPAYTTGRPFVYALYTYDKDPFNAQAPRWNDDCPTPPGPTADGCTTSGRLSKLTAGGGEQVLIEDWCQQYTSHSIGDLAFAADGALYVSAGDGASYTFADYGQDGSPLNPCGDPPAARGGAMTPPTADGGALRSQDVRTAGDPTSGDGTILRVDPDTGAARPDNPNASATDPMTRRIIAYGLRNPFRIAIRPGSGEVWAGDVGWTQWEEVNRIPSPTTEVRNYGWPCYEGVGRMSSYDNANLNTCESLYAAGAAAHTGPHYTYPHSDRVVPGEDCPFGGSSISAIAFYSGTQFPARYRNGLFFGDYVRSCIWFMPLGANGQPDPAQRETFVSGAEGVVGLTMGPDGSLYYPDIINGAIKRISYPTANSAPTARVTTSPATGPTPLTVQFDGTGSSDADGDELEYAWDLDGDAAFDDGTAATATWAYATPGQVNARLRVTDSGGLEDVATVTVRAGAPPTARIDTPDAGFTWAVGDQIGFAGGGVDGQGAAVPAARMTWRLLLQHCAEGLPQNCHTHVVQTWSGIAGGSVVAPDHEYPSYLELELTVADAAGLTDVVKRRLDPKTVNLTFETSPAGLQLSVGSFSGAAPFTRTVIVGSTQTVSAPAPQTAGGSSYGFTSWSDGGAQNHGIVAPATPATYRASFTQLAAQPGLVGAWAFDESFGDLALDGSGNGRTGTLDGATRATGRYGGALSFDGLNDWVTVADAPALRLTDAMTLEAWVNPASLGSSWRTALLKERGAGLGYALYANNGANRAAGFVNSGGADAGVLSAATVPAAAWTHLATTYDGATLRIYVNGSEVATQAASGAITSSTGPLRFGGNGAWLNEFYSGRLDEIRVYDRALGTAQVAADMNTPIGAAPPPPALSVTPAALSFSGTQGGASPAAKSLAIANTGGGTLSYSASDDAPWLSVTPASGTAPQSASVAASLAGLAPGTYSGTVTVTATGAQNSPAAIPVTLTVAAAPPPTPALAVAPASLAFSAVAGGAAPATQTLNVTNAGGGTLSYTAADDAAWLTVAPASGTAPQALTVTASQTGLAAGAYSATVTVTAAGATGSPKTVPVGFAVSTPPVTGGLVAAYGFDEASGATAIDSSGAGNPGVVSGASRTAAGRSGGALEFDGINDWVTVADANSLDLTAGMTLQAWVYPTAAGTAWRTVIMKERPAGLAYALYGNDNGGRPQAFAFTGSELGARGPSALPLNTWSHVAATYSGTTLRLYVGGTQVATRTVGSALRTSANPLRIGGNAIWNEWFQGRIDEVRVYNRALTAADIQADMSRPVATAAGAAQYKTNARKLRRQLRRARKRASVRLEPKRRGRPLRAHKR